MMNTLTHAQQQNIMKLIRKKCGSNIAAKRVEPLRGDGSDRCFYRITVSGPMQILAILPSESGNGRSEARSAYMIGTHLKKVGVSVPGIYGYDADSGIILCEDLGDILLYDEVTNNSTASRLEYYKKAIDALIVFQVDGVNGFMPEYCWDTPVYDADLMRQRESGYFLEAFCRGYLKISNIPREVVSEFSALADSIALIPATYLLHRDYQSRNLMLCQGKLRIIDFQGARFGPLGYDLASLLIDPYICLSPPEQQQLLSYYIYTLNRKVSLDADRFVEGYRLLAIHRNLQILGAFAFLSQEKGKMFFEQYIAPAYRSLLQLSQSDEMKRYGAIRTFIASLQALPRLDKKLDE